VSGSRVRFRFRGKGGVDHEVGIRDRQLARIVARCLDLPGQPLFQWVDEQGAATDLASDDVNDYLREAMGGDFTAKDFRTWAGTLLAYRALRELGPAENETEARHNVVVAIRETSIRLRNTPAVCRRSYVDPAILDAYLDGSFRETAAKGSGPKTGDPDAAKPSGATGSEPAPDQPPLPTLAEERAVISILEARSRR
jgi:DNA topoisomerase-1